MPPLVKVARPLNVVGPNTLMVPRLLMLLESAKVLVRRVFQMPELINLLLALPVIETVPVTTPRALLIKVASPLPEVATAKSPARPEIFWIVPEFVIWMGPLFDVVLTPLIVPSVTPPSTSILVVPPPALIVWMPLPLLEVTFALVITEMLPCSALNASMPFCAVAPVTVIGPLDLTETLPLPKLKAKMPWPPAALMVALLTTLTVPLTLGFGVSVVHPVGPHEAKGAVEAALMTDPPV